MEVWKMSQVPGPTCEWWGGIHGSQNSPRALLPEGVGIKEASIHLKGHHSLWSIGPYINISEPSCNETKDATLS